MENIRSVRSDLRQRWLQAEAAIENRCECKTTSSSVPILPLTKILQNLHKILKQIIEKIRKIECHNTQFKSQFPFNHLPVYLF